ncbi:MAG: hypothetical protein DMG53_21440, partial [Acidobacteria bacterium]
FNYEGTRISRGVLRISTVPLPNERTGDFSPAAAAANGIAPYPTIYDLTTGQPFNNNQIPQGSIDPFATKIMALFPLPNLSGQLNNYVRNALLTDNADSYNGRVDWVPSQSDNIFARYSYSNRNRFIPGYYGGIGDGTSTSAWGRQVLKGQSAVIGWTHVFTPTLVNEFRLGFIRDYSFAEQDPFGQNKVDEFVPGVPDNPAVAGGISQITLTNFTFIGSPDFLPKQQVPQQFQWVDNLSKTLGNHALKFGLDLRAPMRNIYQDEPGTREAAAQSNPEPRSALRFLYARPGRQKRTGEFRSHRQRRRRRAGLRPKRIAATPRSGTNQQSQFRAAHRRLLRSSFKNRAAGRLWNLLHAS